MCWRLVSRITRADALQMQVGERHALLAVEETAVTYYVVGTVSTRLQNSVLVVEGTLIAFELVSFGVSEG